MSGTLYGYLYQYTGSGSPAVLYGYGGEIQPTIFESKFAYDSLLYTLDFSSALPSGDHISSVSGISSSPSGQLSISSGTIVSGQIGASGAVQTRISSGQAGILYTLTYEIVTSGGDQFARQALIQVQ